MTVRFKAHQLKPPLRIGALLDANKVISLSAITAWFPVNSENQIRSQRRALLSTLRYVRTRGIDATQSEWTYFAEKISSMPLAWDEAKDARYRYRVPGAKTISPRALTMFLKATLDQTPPGWHSSQQTRQHYRYVARSLPNDFKSFIPDDNPSQQSLFQSMRAMVGKKFPSPHSSFIEAIATKNVVSLTTKTWPQTFITNKVNDQLVQAAFSLARYPDDTVLSAGIHKDVWFDTRKPMLPDAGVSLSFFEIIQRLPGALGRPVWMPAAFAKIVANETDSNCLRRGWNAVNFTETERFGLILGLAKDYPRSSTCSLEELLKYNWTIPVETRKAMALKEYMTFGDAQTDVSIEALRDNAREWISLVVPEMKSLLDLCSGAGPAEEIMQLQQFLTPAETSMLDLPQSFDALTNH